jgi:hypothetical protein
MTYEYPLELCDNLPYDLSRKFVTARQLTPPGHYQSEYHRVRLAMRSLRLIWIEQALLVLTGQIREFR